MSDTDLILQFLEKAEKRDRSTKRFSEISTTLAIAFIVPVLFKLLDFWVLFRAHTVTAFFTLWFGATIVWIVIRLHGRSPLGQIAAAIDYHASLQDQLKTAYWFIRNPRESEWVDAHLQRTAKGTSRIRLDSLYPRKLPRTSLIAVALLFVFIALNFVPLSRNRNWVYLQAEPSFSLNEAERANLEKALKLLERAKSAENAQLVQQVEELVHDLQQGDLSLSEAIKQLDTLKDELEASALATASMTNGLDQMTGILRQAKPLQKAVQPMGKGDLKEAASQLRQLSGQLQTLSPDDTRDMGQKLHTASRNPRGGLQDLAQAFDMTSIAIQQGDRSATQSGLDRIARELENLKDRMRDQAIRAEAGDALAHLLAALQGRDHPGAIGREADFKSGPQVKASEKAGGTGETGEKGRKGADEAHQSGDNGEEGQPDEGNSSDQSAKAAGQSPGAPNETAPVGRGGNPFGGATKRAPLEGEATSLEVQLQKEALPFQNEGGGREPNKDAVAAGERERSKLDYRNAPSDLTPAQKDVLSQDRIPWDSRQLIKNYFQAIKPNSK